MKQYACIDADFQAFIFDKMADCDVMPCLHSMLCMTTVEMLIPAPLLVTVLKDDVVLESEDATAFREQYRRSYNIHHGIWFVIARTPGQYDFLRKTLPVGHCVFVQLSASREACAEMVTDFVLRLQMDDSVDRAGVTKGSFKIDTAVCEECMQTYRIVSGVYLSRNRDVFDDSPMTDPKVFVPAKEFSYPLYKYACERVNTHEYVCSLCGEELVTEKEDILPETPINLCLTADDCLRYFLPTI